MQTEFWVWMFIFFGFLMALLIILVLIWYLPLRKWAENFGYRTVLGFSGHPLAPWLDPHTDSLRILSLRRSWRSDRAGGLKGEAGAHVNAAADGKRTYARARCGLASLLQRTRWRQTHLTSTQIANQRPAFLNHGWLHVSERLLFQEKLKLLPEREV